MWPADDKDSLDLEFQRIFFASQPRGTPPVLCALAVIHFMVKVYIGSYFMSRHLDNVNRLFVKFRNRYGDKYPVVLQVKTALCIRSGRLYSMVLTRR